MENVLSKICSPFLLAQNPYDYAVTQSNPFEAMKQGIEVGKQLNKNNDPNAMASQVCYQIAEPSYNMPLIAMAKGNILLRKP